MTATAASAAAPEPYRRCHGDAGSGRGGGLSSRHSSVRGRKRLFLFTLNAFLPRACANTSRSSSGARMPSSPILRRRLRPGLAVCIDPVRHWPGLTTREAP